MDPAIKEELQNSISRLEGRLEAQESANAARVAEIEARLEEHSSKLAEVPSTAQIVAAMENIKLASVQNAASARQMEGAARGMRDQGDRLKALVVQYKV